MNPEARAPPTPEQIGDNIRLLRDLLGADLVDAIVQVVLSLEQIAFLERLGLREHSDAYVQTRDIGLRGLTPKVEEALLEATVPSGITDPCRLGGDVVWVLAIKAVLAVDPARASKLARRWCAHLTRLAWDHEEGAVHPVTFATAGYSVAFLEHLQGRHHEVQRWLQEADSHVAHEDPPELAILAYLRACRLWAG